MENQNQIALNASKIVFLSILLIFFTIPHTLEDFVSGEPGKAGIPAPLLALVVSVIFALQALGLYWLGQNKRRGIWVHLMLGVFWPLASGFAQVPTRLNEPTYRSGTISIVYVMGIIIIGFLLLIFSGIGLWKKMQLIVARLNFPDQGELLAV